MVNWKNIIESPKYGLTEKEKRKFYDLLVGDEGGRDPELNSRVLYIDKTIMRKMKDDKSYQKLKRMVNDIMSEDERAVVIELSEEMNDGMIVD